MFGFLKKWVSANANPIGVDFGSDCLRMVQIRVDDGEPQIIAAGCADVPSHLRNDPAARGAFFVETVRDLLAQGSFVGRKAILALPAAQMHIQHLRIPKLDEEATRKALPWEARGKLPMDPSHALLRHIIAGEIYHDSEPRNEVILMAAARDSVNNILNLAARAKLDVIGMNVEPMAVIDCFDHIYRRKSDKTQVMCYVDIGYKATRAIIAQGRRILFARSIPVGGEHFNRAVGQAMNIGGEEAKLLRIKLCQMQPAMDEHRARQEIRAEDAPPAAADEGFALLNASIAAAQKNAASTPAATVTLAAPPRLKLPADPAEQMVLVEEACHEPLVKLVEELDLCRRYHEATFPSSPVEKLIFFGGEARQRRLCQHIAREMSLAAQVGDPLVRMGRISEVGIESGIDRRQPQPGWVTSIGLSLGPCGTKEQANG